jgi:signal recognition particle receptor subunit beta
MAHTHPDESATAGKSIQLSLPSRSSEDPRTSSATSLDKIRTDLMLWGQQLNRLVHGPAQMLAQDGQQVLADLVCRIAVIGQVKAGKSSFVNALIGLPGLLPADVNPWTTAVTKLHFNCSNAPEGVAAAFKFFDHDEWKKIAEGGGRIRELTERLVPGFTPAVLSRHLEAMRRRAESRLGREFPKLLGTTHTFPTLDHDILERYVCAGPDGEAMKPDDGPGQYSDITKTADLYFKSNGFGFPTILIDTPGTNDPFLVRDEITRRSLDGADFHIVVLTAQQPLSTADVTLFRMLRGLHKERIVVFINRIDQLTNLPDDALAVAERVHDGLRAEFPDIDVPIVVGSARWANSSLLLNRGDLSSILSPAFHAYAQHVTGRELGAKPDERPQISTDEMTRVLMACSGIAELNDHVNRAILNSHASRAIAHISANFCELARLGETSTRDEIVRLDQLMRMTANSVEAREQEAGKLEENARRTRQLCVDLEQTILKVEQQLNTLAQTECDALSRALNASIESFSRQECLRLDDVMSHDKPVRSWRCDPAALRRVIEAEYLKRFRETESRILDPERNIFLRLRQSVAQVLPDAFQGPAPTLQPPPITPLSLSILGRALVFDLDHPWWLAWWKGRLSKEDRLKELDGLIKREFLPVVDNLVSAARSRLMKQVAATLLSAQAICGSVVDALRAQSEWRDAKVQELLLTNIQKSDDLTDEHRRNLATLRECQQKWQTVGRSLAEVRDRCQRLLSGCTQLQSASLMDGA